jgi:hypothetical protein
VRLNPLTAVRDPFPAALKAQAAHLPPNVDSVEIAHCASERTGANSLIGMRDARPNLTTLILLVRTSFLIIDSERRHAAAASL